MAHKPKPFKRPGIELGRHGRMWKTLPAQELCSGDIVQDRGLIMDIAVILGPHILVDYFNREVDLFKPDDQVYAFVKRAEEHSD